MPPRPGSVIAAHNGSQTTVAVVDGSGCQLDHPDIAANIVHPYDAAQDDSVPAPENAYANHSTSCSGIVAAVTNNGVGRSLRRGRLA